MSTINPNFRYVHVAVCDRSLAQRTCNVSNENDEMLILGLGRTEYPEFHSPHMSQTPHGKERNLIFSLDVSINP